MKHESWYDSRFFFTRPIWIGKTSFNRVGLLIESLHYNLQKPETEPVSLTKQPPNGSPNSPSPRVRPFPRSADRVPTGRGKENKPKTTLFPWRWVRCSGNKLVWGSTGMLPATYKFCWELGQPRLPPQPMGRILDLHLVSQNDLSPRCTLTGCCSMMQLLRHRRPSISLGWCASWGGALLYMRHMQ